MQGVVRLAVEVCAQYCIFLFIFFLLKKGGAAKNKQLVVIVELFTCSIFLPDTEFNKIFMQYLILIGPDWLFLWRPVYIQKNLKLLHKNI